MQPKDDSRWIYVDVDGTLLLWPPPHEGRPQFPETPKINERLISQVKLAKIHGATVVVWILNPTVCPLLTLISVANP